MASPTGSGWSFRTGAFLAVLAGILSLGWWAMSRPPRLHRVMILAPAGGTQDPALREGLEALLVDHLEVLAGATVIRAPQAPASADLARLPQDLVLLRFQGRREGNRLALEASWTTVARLLRGRPWSQQPGELADPGVALDRWVAHWPLPLRFRTEEALRPRDPARFWDLLRLMAIQDDRMASESIDTTRRLVEAEPGCASAWTALGDELYRSLWVHPERTGSNLNGEMNRAFEHALALVPGHPRATYLWSQMLTDIGDQRRALQALVRAERLRPGVPDLYLGFAYAGRTAGLLEGAQRALARRKEILGPLAVPSPWSAETTYLYLGQTTAFGQELAGTRAVRQDASLLFYEGYLALLNGHGEQALSLMREGAAFEEGPEPFQDLCRAYQALLEGRYQDGLAGLRDVDQVRGRLRVPDGEWTFKEAEAYALLGDPDRGMDCATRAFVQGFSCTRWFETSPFLAAVRARPRWPTLLRNVQERQAMLEHRFPASVFAP